MLEPEDKTKSKAMIGRIRTCFVRNATTTRVIVKAIIPVSDIKNLAGGILNQRNASKPPTITKQKAEMSIWFCKRANTP